LMVDGKKMSKSANNFYRILDLEEKYSHIKPSVLYRAIRLSFINAKYNSEVNFTFEKVESNINTINSIDEIIKNITREIEKSKNDKVVSKDFREAMQDYIHEYMFHLEDDFNIPECLAVMHNFIKFVNTWLREKLFSKSELESAIDMFKTFNQVLAIMDFNLLWKEEIPEEINKKLQERNNAKINKDFSQADSIRDELLSLWYKIVDSRDWSYVEKI